MPEISFILYHYFTIFVLLYLHVMTNIKFQKTDDQLE